MTWRSLYLSCALRRRDIPATHCTADLHNLVALAHVRPAGRRTSWCNMSGAMSKEAIAFDRLEVQLRRRASPAF